MELFDFFLRIFMKFEAKNLSPVAFHALICVEVSVSIKCFDWSKMAAEVFPVALIDNYAKPCEPAIHVLRSVATKRKTTDSIPWPCLAMNPGGFFHQNRTWMCLPDLENLTISIPIFCQISHPSVYHFRKKSTQFGSNWVLFTIICPKYTQFM